MMCTTGVQSTWPSFQHPPTHLARLQDPPEDRHRKLKDDDLLGPEVVPQLDHRLMRLGAGEAQARAPEVSQLTSTRRATINATIKT